MQIKMRFKIVLFFIFFSPFAHAQIYHCKQADGSTKFQDHDCADGASGAKSDAKPEKSASLSNSDNSPTVCGEEGFKIRYAGMLVCLALQDKSAQEHCLDKLAAKKCKEEIEGEAIEKDELARALAYVANNSDLVKLAGHSLHPRAVTYSTGDSDGENYKIDLDGSGRYYAIVRSFRKTKATEFRLNCVTTEYDGNLGTCANTQYVVALPK